MKGLVYNQVWEDHAVDAEGLQVGPDDRVLLITSGGCKVLNTLVHDPARVVAVDTNPAQNELLRRKMEVIRRGSHRELWERFGAPAQRQRGSVYREGAYAHFRAVASFFRLACGWEPIGQFLESRTLQEQAAHYRERIEPALWRAWVRRVPTPSVAILGVHPRQLLAVLREGAWTLERVCRARLAEVLCGFPIRDNPYWHQMLAGAYAGPEQAPPYLHPARFEALRGALPRVEIHQANLVDLLARCAPASFTRVCLLDMPDFLDHESKGRLFAALARALAPGARGLVRSFPTQPRYPLSPEHFAVDEEASARLTRRERTASYGRVTLFHRRA